MNGLTPRMSAALDRYLTTPPEDDDFDGDPGPDPHEDDEGWDVALERAPAPCPHPRLSRLMANGKPTSIVFCPDCKAVLSGGETILGRQYPGQGGAA